MPNRHNIPSMETGEDAKFNAAAILFARGAHHRGLRAAWQPMFHSESLTAFQAMMVEAADKLCALLEDAAETARPVDVWRRLGDFTMQVSGTTAFGVDIPAQDAAADDGASSALVKSAKDFFDAAGQIEGIYALLQVTFPSMAPAVRQLASVLPTPTYAAGRRGRHAVQAKVSKLLEEHRKASSLEQQVNNKVEREKGTGVAPSSFLDLMARSINKETGKPFSDMEVTCQSFSFVLAAYETTTASMAFALHLLATHPDKEAKLLAEIDAFGCDKVPTFAQVTDGKTFPYTEAVFKESLRLFPPVPLTIREANKDLQLGSYTVPAGTHLAVCIYGMHRDPANWHNPESFIPERFLTSLADVSSRKEIADNMDAYMPFGDGPRGCIGQKYAWQEAMIVLIRLYQKYTFKLVDEKKPLDVRMSLSLTPRHGVNVIAKRRR
jgi:cytochrome P450